MQELEVLRNETYENALIYMEKRRIFNDQQVSRKAFVVGQKVLYHSRLNFSQVSCVLGGLVRFKPLIFFILV